MSTTTRAAAWQPGDVALRTGRDGSQVLSLVVRARFGMACVGDHGASPHWHHANGGWNQLNESEEFGTYRPLVVIDPEDREQVEQLELGLADALGWSLLHNEPRVTGLQAALREFASTTPPKPDEPTAPLAVVEDVEGRRWYRLPPKRTPSHYWASFDDPSYDRNYDDIQVVRVLFNGTEINDTTNGSTNEGTPL